MCCVFLPCIFIFQTLCIVYKCIHVHHLRLTNVNKAITYLLTYLLTYVAVGAIAATINQLQVKK